MTDLKSLGFEIVIIEESYIEARRGSQLAFRIKGAMLAKASDFPIVACLKLSETPAGSEVDFVIHEDLGVGTIVGAQKKYQVICDDVRNLLRFNLQRQS